MNVFNAAIGDRISCDGKTYEIRKGALGVIWFVDVATAVQCNAIQTNEIAEIEVGFTQQIQLAYQDYCAEMRNPATAGTAQSNFANRMQISRDCRTRAIAMCQG